MKGLEFDHVIIANVQHFTDPRQFYVALNSSRKSVPVIGGSSRLQLGYEYQRVAGSTRPTQSDAECESSPHRIASRLLIRLAMHDARPVHYLQALAPYHGGRRQLPLIRGSPCPQNQYGVLFCGSLS